MGTRRHNKKGKKNKTKRKKKTGGNPYGIIPAVTYANNEMVQFVVQDRLDNKAYTDRNRVYPVSGNSSWFDFDKIHDRTRGFFTMPGSQTNDPVTVREVKIAINSVEDIAKMNVLNKLIRRYNTMNNMNYRKNKMFMYCITWF